MKCIDYNVFLVEKSTDLRIVSLLSVDNVLLMASLTFDTATHTGVGRIGAWRLKALCQDTAGC